MDVIERVAEREDVGSTLERRVAAIAQRPIAALELGRNQAAAVKVSTGSAAGGTSQVGVGNATGHDGGGGAGPRALRGDVVKDAVVTEGGLVDHVGIEHMGFAQADIARVVSDALVAAESVRFGKSW